VSDLYARLRRIKEQQERGGAHAAGPNTAGWHADSPTTYLSPGSDWTEDAPGVFVRRLRHPAGRASGAVLSPLLRVGDSGRLLAIDIETTGLSGGAGNVAFLVGLGELDTVGPDGTGEIRLTQLFLGDFDAEPAFLDALETLLSGAADATRANVPPRVYLTYNGSRFDLPVLRSRFLLNRRRFPEELHLDVLHLTRRLYGRAIGSCSLGNVEERVLGVRRDLDLPSAEVPGRYLEYLKLRQTEQLDAVFAHHESDVVNLLRLAILINTELLRAASGDESAIPGVAGGALPPDPIALARLFLERSPDPDAARSILLRVRRETELRRRSRAAGAAGALARRLGAELPRGWVESRTMLTGVARRAGDLDLMRAVLEEMLEIRGTLEDAEELAKYWEHRRGDPVRALSILRDYRDRTGEWSATAEYRAARLRRKPAAPRRHR